MNNNHFKVKLLLNLKNKFSNFYKTFKFLYKLNFTENGLIFEINRLGFSILFFLFFVILNLNYQFTGINNNLYEIHAFRQTQTALTSLFINIDGFQMPYLTPVLGAPWTLPFEFPLYQIIVAYIYKISELNMDAVGRLVSICFFYLSILYVYKILRYFLKESWKVLLILPFILIHPVYLYWSRTFMIESTALFFSVAFIFYVIKYNKNLKIKNFILAIIFGSFAFLVKITTILPLYFVLLFYLIFQHIKKSNYNNKRILLSYLVLLLIPIICGKVWIDYCDYIKSKSQYIYSITSSKKLQTWNFGTIEQKINFNTWLQISKNTSTHSKYFYLTVLISVIFIFYKKSKYAIPLSLILITYFLYPMIFTNLYFVHQYYTYANMFLFCIVIGIIVLFFFEQSKYYQIFTIYLILYFSIFFIGRYKYDYFFLQRFNFRKVEFFCKKVKSLTKQKDVVIVYGNDWSSDIAYYSQRKTLSLKNKYYSINQKTISNLLKRHEDYNLKTLVIVKSDKNSRNESFVNQLISKLDLNLKYRKDNYYLYCR